MASADVRLPRKHRAQFPDRCVQCNADHPESLVTIWTSTQGWWTFITLFWGKPVRIVAPVCPGCRWRLRLGRWGDGLLIWAVGLAVIFTCMPFIEPHVPRPLAKYAVLIPFIICLVPYIIWKTYWPPAFDVTAYEKSIDYEFRSLDYAMEFCDLNEEVVETVLYPE
ncbi:hypothetical protein [Aeoliella mucimassa]|uniref:Uncharacterized protein n=1 Tax=Aeoliella mucimassa TaxID=2527972 RepID=A0A518AVB8_9BACT|nr:hypothetical protein [Aeoliella mucimassa]QDU58679.1 hypothetical protein Pan181_49190 [Aeoliella mucimassa]